MNILFLCHRFPYPPASGSKVRAFHMIRHLHAQGHRVHVVSLARNDQEMNEVPGIAQHCHAYSVHRVHNPLQVLRMAALLPTPTPSSMGFFHSGAMAREVRSLLARERFDLIVVHCSSVAQYVEHVRDIPKLLDFADMDSQKWLDYARFKPQPMASGYRFEGMKLERAERRLTGLFEACAVTTLGELETLDSFNLGSHTDWFPNGVDSGYFAPMGDAYEPNTISFVGRMDYYPNQECMFDFCANVVPLLRARRPDIKLQIIGADPSLAVRKLGEQPGVVVTGSVPDVRPFLRKSALTVAPLNIARGTQNKVLESMVLGIPVVASRLAARGVDAIDGEHLLVAGNAQEYAQAIERVLAAPQERERLARAGRERMLAHHSWPHAMRRFDAIVEQCLAARRVAAPAVERVQHGA
jgi:polysaccharide biosynthesis protein PslH